MANVKGNKPVQKRAGKKPGRVVEVISANTLVIEGKDGKKYRVVIQGIQSPRVGRRTGKDEPYAWGARDYVRKNLLRKVVQFEIVYTTESGVQYAKVYFNKSRIAYSLLAQGYGKLIARNVTEDNREYDEYKKLEDMQAKAKDSKKGIHNKSKRDMNTRKVNWKPNNKAFFKKNVGKKLKGVIEKVQDGSTFKIEIIGETLKDHIMITLNLAGVKCNPIPLSEEYLNELYLKRLENDPRARKPVVQKIKPFAQAALDMVKGKLLQREIEVVLQTIDKSDHLYGTVLHTAGNISEVLLSAGYGKYVSWSGAKTDNAEKLQKLEQQAKDKKKRLWKDHQKQEEKQQDEKFATVMQIQQGDIIHVKQNNKDLKVRLASIMCPRAGPQGEYLGAEAREYVRKQLIGEQVELQYEYTRNPQAEAKNQDKRLYYTVLFRNGSSNMGVELCEKGLAKVVAHRKDEERSYFYGDLVAAENVAKEKKKGLYGPRKSTKKPIDLTGRKNKSVANASGYLTQLQGKSFKAVVEWIVSPTKIKVYVPSHKLFINIVLSGISNNTPIDKELQKQFSEQAREYLNHKLLNREVYCEVSNTDKADNFIGFIKKDGLNLSAYFLNRGWVDIYEGSARRSNYKDELFRAVDIARDEKNGLWKHFVPKELPKEDDEKKVVQAEQKVFITEIVSPTSFYCQFGDSSMTPEEIEKKLNSQDLTQLVEVKQKETIAAPFGDDDSALFRAKVVRSHKKDGELDVFYVDYGNYGTVKISECRKLPGDLMKVKPLAVLCSLTGLKDPPHQIEEYESALGLTTDLLFEKQVTLKTIFYDRYNKWLSVVTRCEDQETTVNEMLIEVGMAIYDKKLSTKKVAPEMQEQLKQFLDLLGQLETAAKDKQQGMWQFTDSFSE